PKNSLNMSSGTDCRIRIKVDEAGACVDGRNNRALPGWRERQFRVSGNDQLMISQVRGRHRCGDIDKLIRNLKILKIPLCIPLVGSGIRRISIESRSVRGIHQNSYGQIKTLRVAQSGPDNAKRQKGRPLPDSEFHPSLPGSRETFFSNIAARAEWLLA